MKKIHSPLVFLILIAKVGLAQSDPYAEWRVDYDLYNPGDLEYNALVLGEARWPGKYYFEHGWSVNGVQRVFSKLRIGEHYGPSEDTERLVDFIETFMNLVKEEARMMGVKIAIPKNLTSLDFVGYLYQIRALSEVTMDPSERSNDVTGIHLSPHSMSVGFDEADPTKAHLLYKGDILYTHRDVDGSASRLIGAYEEKIERAKAYGKLVLLSPWNLLNHSGHIEGTTFQWRPSDFVDEFSLVDVSAIDNPDVRAESRVYKAVRQLRTVLTDRLIALEAVSRNLLKEADYQDGTKLDEIETALIEFEGSMNELTIRVRETLDNHGNRER